MNSQVFSSGPRRATGLTPTKRLGVMACVTILLLLSLLWGLQRLTARAEWLPQPSPESTDVSLWTIVKTVSHDSAAPGSVLTFTIDVHNASAISDTVEVVDLLPAEMEEPMGIVADANVTFTVGANGLEFTVMDLEPGRSARLTYRAMVSPDADCGKELVNQAQLVKNDEPIDTVEAYVRVICSDLGDAPASENHFGTDMFLISGVKALYPTVYNPPSGAPSGPLHQRADLMHLGQAVSFERQADVGPDSDPTNNIVPTLNSPDLDRFDDGLLNPDKLSFAHCEPATLELEVYIHPALAEDLDRVFINVWFDGNRDGDWADVKPCDDPDASLVPEHIVIDHPVSAVAGHQIVLVTTTVPVYNPMPQDPAWLRVTLSEQRSVKIDKVGPWDYGDGRGVFSTLIDAEAGEEVAGFRLGETEDYFLPRPIPEPGLVITKTVDPTQAGSGDVLTYTIMVTNTHAAAQEAAVFDPIPPGTAYVPGSFVASLPGLASGYHAGHNAVFWVGEIPARQSLTIEFAVRILRCAPDGFRVVNLAWALERGFPPVEAKAVTDVRECIDPPPRRVWVRKLASSHAFPDDKVEYTLIARNAMPDTVPLVVVDPLPLGLWVEPSTLPSELEFIPPNVILWETAVRPGEAMTVTFHAYVHEWACREDGLRNQAYWWSAIGLDGYSNPTWTDIVCSDLGDAPDSTFNHHNMTNTAYTLTGTVVISPLVPGRFPSVWEAAYPPGEASGPRHYDATRAWLGKNASYELEADKGPDTDGLNNILAFGLDNADNDRFDDGWLNPHVPLPDCREATLRVRVSKGHYTADRMWLNVWFDGNRDGDWEDWKFCDDDERRAFEWIVQNFVVDMSTLPVGAHRDIVVRTRLIMNDHPHKLAWMRFTLSERQPPRNPTTGLADGRGPNYELMYRWGETEDYQAPGMPVGTPGEVSIDKAASTITATLGQVYTYSVYLSHSDGSGPAYAVMTDVLPAEVALAGKPTVTELHPSATPLVAYYNSHIGPNGAVGWRGFLSPDAAIRVDFPVRVKYCPPNELYAIRNEAVVHQLGTPSVQSAVVETPLICTPPPEPNIELRKRIVTDLDEWLDEWTTVPGEHVMYRLVLSGTNEVTHAVHISDPMQSGVVAVAAGATSGVAHIVHGGRVVVWDGQLGPAIDQVVIRIRVRLREVDCGSVVENVAYWYTRFHHGESNPTWLRLACHDLGDAPDSSNHFNTDMMAYPGITATFPTVFAATMPLVPHGPLHLRPWPLHLGPRVSFEVEADLGIDLDGINNIEPRWDRADLDKADDGLKLHELDFTHCEPHRFPVWISVHPFVFSALEEDRLAYLNVWLDSNRDGDWNDAYECPEDPELVLAPEHIVIDDPIDLAALGPGVHLVYVTTTGPVPWPDDLTGPAWLRATLSERKSNKTLPPACTTAPDCEYGDGRGYEHPFALGETEDYLVRGPEQPDLTVEKHGFIYPLFEYDRQTESGRMVWKVGWPVHYKNIGGVAANDVQVVDTFGSGQDLVKVRSYPYIPPVVSGTMLTFAVGTLSPGQGGHIFVHTSVPFTTAPGTVLTNTVVITGHEDRQPDNNRYLATVTVPLLPPLITYPRSGATCTGLFTITGRSQLPGAVIAIFINHSSVTTVTTDAQGEWYYPVNLPDGTYKIQAQASYGGLTSSLSLPVKVIVDTSLAWSPLSLRFISEHGHVVIPKDENGFSGEDGWFVFLRPGVTYTATVFLCCDDPNASVILWLPDGQEVHLEDADGDGWYEGVFTMAEGTLLPSGSAIRLCVVCYETVYCSEGEVLIDPEGVVFDVNQGQESGLLEDAVVACYEMQTDLGSGETIQSLWPAESFDQVNPQTTVADGYFSFFTPAGVYQLDVTREGYQPYQSWDLVVVDEPVEFNVPLTPDTSEEADATITINESGFDPAVVTVESGAVIEWINVGDEPHTTTSVTPTARVGELAAQALDNTDGWDSGMLESGESYKRQLHTPGTYYYYDYENMSYTGVVIVESAQIYLPLVLRDS